MYLGVVMSHGNRWLESMGYMMINQQLRMTNLRNIHALVERKLGGHGACLAGILRVHATYGCNMIAPNKVGYSFVSKLYRSK